MTKNDKNSHLPNGGVIMTDGIEHIPPFIEERPAAPVGKFIQAGRLVIMLVAILMLSVSMLGCGKLLWDILNEGVPSVTMLGAKLLWVVIPFLVGWIISLVDIRKLNNLVLPLVIRIFIWVTLFGILAIYARTIYKLYTELFSFDHYLRYSLVFAAGFAVMVGLHLLIEDHDLRPYSMPLLVAALIHLLVAVLHYVFLDGDPAFALGDVIYFLSMMFIFALMALHIGLLNPFRRAVDRLFEQGE
jgi:hypothetical protein